MSDSLNPREVVYGERYHDDSGWERRLSVKTNGDYGVTLELSGSSTISCSIADLRWLISAADEALSVLGVGDKP